MNTVDTAQDNEKTPEGASSQTLRLNTDKYTTIFDTLKDHALKLVANASSEMSEEQWSEYVNELTAHYAEALDDWTTSLTNEAELRGRVDELEMLDMYDAAKVHKYIEPRLEELKGKQHD